jgi:hypothetical protein
MVTKERAQEIWRNRSYFGTFLISPEEDRFIREVWATMPGHTCWADALLKIAKGGNEEFASMEDVADVLVVACYRFIEQPPEPFSREEERELASLLADGSRGLPMFAARLRQKLIEICRAVANVDSTRFWQLIDAIGFWRDAHDGAWPYTTDTDRRRYLTWSLEFARKANPEVTS